jgi:hypothetical protein
VTPLPALTALLVSGAFALWANDETVASLALEDGLLRGGHKLLSRAVIVVLFGRATGLSLEGGIANHLSNKMEYESD